MSTQTAFSNWREIFPTLTYGVESEDPWVMPLVLRTERGVPITHEQALSVTAQAVAMLMDDERTLPGAEWHESMKSWMHGRIRKIARRARSSRWESVVSTIPGIVASKEDIEVFVAPPHRMTNTPNELSRLQVSGLELPHTLHDKGHSGLPQLLIAMNPDLPMSTGKSMAQVGHAAQLASLMLPELEVNAWTANYSVKISLEPSDFHHAPANCIVVEDAGFTEIPAGSLTCKAWMI